MMRLSSLCRCLLAFTWLHFALAPTRATPTGPEADEALSEAVSQHVGRFGPLGPDPELAELLAAAALHVRASDGRPECLADSSGCACLPLVLLTIADEGLMARHIPSLIASLAAITPPQLSTGGASSGSLAHAACRRGPGSHAGQQEAESKRIMALEQPRQQSEQQLQNRRSLSGNSDTAQGLDASLVVIATDRQTANACEQQLGESKHSCHLSGHFPADVAGHGGPSLHLAFARARSILNALSLGFGVLYIDPTVTVLADPLPPMLVRLEDVVELPAADADSSNEGGHNSCGDDTSVSGRTGLLLLRPTAAAARCSYDWVVAMRHALVGKAGVRRPMLAANTLLGQMQYAAVIPACVELLGSGYAVVDLALAQCSPVA